MDIIAYTKLKYDFANWPESPLMKSNEIIWKDRIPANFTLSAYEEHAFRNSAYRKVYVHQTNPQMRVEINSITLPSFEDAKEYLVQQLARCERELKRNDGLLRNCDLTFISGETILGALIFIRNDTFVRMSSIGECDIDLSKLQIIDFGFL